jgi:hypothetical protein
MVNKYNTQPLFETGELVWISYLTPNGVIPCYGVVLGNFELNSEKFYDVQTPHGKIQEREGWIEKVNNDEPILS